MGAAFDDQLQSFSRLAVLVIRLKAASDGRLCAIFMHSGGCYRGFYTSDVRTKGCVVADRE